MQLADSLGVTFGYFYDKLEVPAPEFPRLRQTSLRLIENLQRLEMQHPATCQAICEMTATLAKAGN